MRFSLKTAGGLDLGAGALILAGVALIVGSFVAAAALLAPTPANSPTATEPSVSAPPSSTSVARASVALSADRVATVLFVDASTGAGSVARTGDRVDVLGFFSRQVLGSESVTRLLLPDVPVMTADRSGAGIALTLAVPQAGALLLQESLAIGARPFVTLRSVRVRTDVGGVPASYSDTDLAERLAGLR